MKNLLKTEKGFTLVEVLASIVLLTLIVTTFMMMFAMGARTNVASEGLFNSTYEVQNVMEKIIELSDQPAAPTARVETIKSKLGYTQQTRVVKSGTSWDRLTKKVGNQHVMEIRLEETESQFVRVLVEVSEEGNGKSKAKMETLLTWKGVNP